MSPLEKKIKEYLSTEGLSEETILVLKNLKNEVKPIEKQMVNESYQKGFTDKERGKNPTWDHYSSKYRCLIKEMRFGQLS